MFSDDTEKKQRNLIPFETGKSGNPAGRPKGSRAKLGEAFVADLYADWQEHGVATLVRVRDEKPADYVKVVASLLPKDVNLNVNAASDLDDGELAALIAVARQAVATAQAVGEGTGEADGRKPSEGVQTLQ